MATKGKEFRFGVWCNQCGTVQRHLVAHCAQVGAVTHSRSHGPTHATHVLTFACEECTADNHKRPTPALRTAVVRA
jgi:hypothetical protein